MKYIYSNIKTPLTSKEWINMSSDDRIKSIDKVINEKELYKDFKIVNVPDNGQIVFKIEKLITASKRGLLLLDLEEMLKSKIDKGLTVWCEPVGDKSVLRKLRGVTIDSK
tara:strand:- start:27240 stop:27569 length:330 start_codon:yes stop_codon:yes gene_type:complete